MFLPQLLNTLKIKLHIYFKSQYSQIFIIFTRLIHISNNFLKKKHMVQLKVWLGYKGLKNNNNNIMQSGLNGTTLQTVWV